MKKKNNEEKQQIVEDTEDKLPLVENTETYYRIKRVSVNAIQLIEYSNGVEKVLCEDISQVVFDKLKLLLLKSVRI